MQQMLKRNSIGTPEGQNATVPGQWFGGRLPEPGEIEQIIRQGGEIPPDQRMDDYTHQDLLNAIKEKTPYDI